MILRGRLGSEIDNRRWHRLWHWDCCQKRPQFKPLDIKRQTWQ
nr:MAG TPA: hypothetical protein [Caudoviricetes sp.]